MLSLLMLQQGDDETNRPTHCDNDRTTTHKCECGRAMQKCGDIPQPPVDVAMDKRCLTYCKKQNCSCAGMGCRS